ncbi:MAG: sodium-dependent bicarbonate transport family permease [Alphaproteobacteria bacterium]|nr:sodium-dependent bicarbonate transport family permease [Alphaproteobacteria bacterium]
MADVFTLALQNLTAPAVLFFALGVLAGFARSDLTIPDAFAKGLSIYLLLAIGFKGGVAAQATGLTPEFMSALGLGLVLSVAMPFVAFTILRAMSSLDRPTLAATAAHYGSISIVTFVASMDFAKLAGLQPGAYLSAVAAVMETPGIIAALFLAGSAGKPGEGAAPGGKAEPRISGELLREVLLNGSVVVLVGAFAIGLITGQRGMARLDLFVNGLFAGVLCLFLLEMGLVAARRLQGKSRLTLRLAAAGIIVPLCGAALALAGAVALRLDPDTAGVMMTLAASASYIAAPAAVRIALPEGDPGVYLPLAVGVTFPFNIAIGIPLYAGIAQAVL